MLGVELSALAINAFLSENQLQARQDTTAVFHVGVRRDMNCSAVIFLL